MKLYLIAGTYFGTQAEAKPAAAEAGIKASQIGDHEVDVPTDKAGLIDYLNNIAQGNDARGTIVEEIVGAKPQPAAPTPSPAFERAQHNIAVETEIAEHLRDIAEHLRDIADEASAKARDLSDLLS